MRLAAKFFILFIALLLVIAAILAALFMALPTGAAPDFNFNDIDTENQLNFSENKTRTARWQGRQVKYVFNVVNDSGRGIDSGTLHVFRGRPSTWNNTRRIGDSFGGSLEKQAVTVSDSNVTVQYSPGRYFYVVNTSGYYPVFGRFTVPDGDERTETGLEEYNERPDVSTVTLVRKHRVGLSNLSFGIASNTGEYREWSTTHVVRPESGREYGLWKLRVTTGRVDPTRNRDRDKVYDEGVERFSVKFSGPCRFSERVFDPANGIDRFGPDNEYMVDLERSGCVASRSEALRMELKLVTSSTGDGSNSVKGDERASGGENLFDLRLYRSDGRASNEIELLG